MTYEDIKDNVMRIVIGLLALVSGLAIILGAKDFYDYINSPKYTKAICQMNGESLEIKITEIKRIDEEYLITDDKGQKWQLSSRVCTFVE